MNRKIIIRCVVAFVVSLVIVVAFWPTQDEGEVSVTYAGSSTNNPNLVLFTITNRSKTTFVCSKGMQEEQLGNWFEIDDRKWGIDPDINGYSASSYERQTTSTNRWRIMVHYVAPIPDSFLTGTRTKLSRFAHDHNWEHVSQWLRPWNKGGFAYGPIMLGNKPAPPEQK